MQKCLWTKESVSGRARSEKHLEIGHHEETRIRVSAVRVSAADRFIVNSCEPQEPLGQALRGLGKCSGQKLLVWTRVAHASPVSGCFGSPSLCFPRSVLGGPPVALCLHKTAHWKELFVMFSMCRLTRKTLCYRLLAGFFVFTHHR